MNIFHLFIAILIIKLSHSEFSPAFHIFNPHSPPLLPICPLPVSVPLSSVSTTALGKPKDNLKFILPFLDMEIQNDRNLFILEERQRQQIYVLHGHQLFQMYLNRQEKRLSLMGVLEGSVRHMEPVGAKIMYWHGNLLLVVALEEHLEVYQLADHILIQRAELVKDPLRAHEPPPIFEAIEQLTLMGRFQEIFLFSPAKERVMIVAAVNFTKLYRKVRIFEWFNTYFDQIQELTVPALHLINVIGTQIKYLITGRTIKHQIKTILNVYEISPTPSNLLLKQTLTVQSHSVHSFTHQGSNMIVGCSSTQPKCTTFHQRPDGHFSVYKHRTPKEFAFDVVASSSRFLCATRHNQVLVFTNHRLDCYGSFVTDQMGVADLIAYENAFKENYVLLIYKNPFKMLIRIVELEIRDEDLSTNQQSEPEELLASTRHQHLFETTIRQLRSKLLQRKASMDILRKVSLILRPKLKELNIGERVIVDEGFVKRINVVGEYLKSPTQMLQKIEDLRQTYFPQRSKRSDVVANRVKVHRMRVENLKYDGDVIKGFAVNRSNPRQNVLSISPKVITHALNTSELILPPGQSDLLRQSKPDLISKQMTPLRVEHLNLESINGVQWNSFYDSLFLKNRDKLIQGRLVLQSPANIKHLTAKILNGLVVSNLFNLKLPQVIKSDLVISRLSVPNLNATTVNNLVFEDDVVFSGYNTLIQTPVKINHLNISGNLVLPNNTIPERLDANGGNVVPKQLYASKVVVNGSLVINNLKRLDNQTKIILGDQEYEENRIKEKYLLKDQDQNFSFPVVFEEGKISAPYLVSNYLNDYKTEEHMLVDKVETEKPLLLVFMNAHVQGDVLSRDYKSKIEKIKENIIHPGDKVNITGLKIFEAPLEVQNVEALTLNQLPVENLVFKDSLYGDGILKFKDLKAFRDIQVTNSSVVDKELHASHLNNLPLENLFSNDYHMERLYVPHLLETTNLVFHKINGIPFDEFFIQLKVRDDHVVLHKDLLVEGSVEFVEPLALHYINGINWNEYVNNLVYINESADIEGDVCFEGDLTVSKQFEAGEINGYDLERILQSVLRKTKPQLITGLYYFGNINGTHMNVSIVNGINVTEIANLNKKVSEIEGDLMVEQLRIGGNLQGKFDNFESLLSVKEKIQELIKKPWKNLYVLNSASWPLHIKDTEQHELLKYFYKFAVKSQGDQFITGNLKLSQPLITKMQTRLKFLPHLDLDFIEKDALLRNSTQQLNIKGEKHFLKPLYMDNLKALGQLNVDFLNGIDVLRFNQSLYRLGSNEPLKADLKFLQPLTVGHLRTSGLINNLNTSLIYQLNNQLNNALQIQELYVENDLFINNINGMDLSYFLDNRVTLKGPPLEHFGVLHFEHLVIEKEALIQNINGIAIDNMVFKHCPYLQTIMGHKTIGNTLELVGPAHIVHLNNKDLMELYRTSLKGDKNYQFDNLIIDRAVFESGLRILENSNSYDLQGRSLSTSETTSDDNKENLLKFLNEFKANLSISHQDIAYLDYDSNVSIKWSDSGDTLINQTIFHELSRISCCEKNFIKISYQYPNNIYLKNLTSHRLGKTFPNMAVKAENFCRLQKRKVKSKITMTGPRLYKVFGMKRYIEAIYSLDIFKSTSPPDYHDHHYNFVILHALDLPSLKHNEVRIFKIPYHNNTIEEWQSLTGNIGEKLKFYQFLDLNILITNGLIDHYPGVTIYHFNSSNQLFELQETIAGDYNIIEMLQLPNNAQSKQLLLSCTTCQRIFIYELKSTAPASTSGSYEILQIITFKSVIDKLITFCLNTNCYMLVISQNNSNFYNLYKYSYIQGWLHITFGYFPQLQMSIPLTQLWTKRNNLIVANSLDDGLPLMLLCNLNNCYLIRAVL